ncbi:MAG: multidrug effflux MFS transporter [Lautropia sp.]
MSGAPPDAPARAADPPPIALSQRKLTLLIASLSSLGPFAIDSYLPAFGAIEASLGATPLQLQQTLSVYLLTFTVMMLWHGAIADAFGRRRAILAALAVFTAGTVGAALAGSIEQLWFWRAVQGLAGGAGMSIGRAVVRDRVGGAQAQRMLAQVMMMFAVAPAIAPIIGGWVTHWFGWRAVFGLLALMSLTLFVAIARWLPETLPPERRQSFRPRDLFVAYRGVFGSLDFWRLAGALGLNFQGLFLMIMAAPALLTRHLGLSETEFGWLFVPTTIGMMSGSFAASRLAGRRPLDWSIRAGYAVMAVGAMLGIAFNLGGTPPLALAIAPLVIYTAGMGVSMSALQVRVLDLAPQRAGLVSSSQGFVQSLFNVLTAAVLVPLLWNAPLHLAYGMAGLLVAGASLYLWHHSRRGPAAFHRSTPHPGGPKA